jgi:hypothetical protein
MVILIVWFLVQFEKTYIREFFKDFKLHSSFGTRAILIVFEKLTRAYFFSKLHSKPYDYILYKSKQVYMYINRTYLLSSEWTSFNIPASISCEPGWFKN